MICFEKLNYLLLDKVFPFNSTCPVYMYKLSEIFCIISINWFIALLNLTKTRALCPF